MNKTKWFLNGGRGSGRTIRLLCEAYENKIAELEEKNIELLGKLAFTENALNNAKAQIEKMKKYAKLLQDICVVLGNDNFMVAVQLESVVKKLWDTSEEKEGLRMVEDIENRLLEIKPQEWAEITKWEIKEND